MAIPWVGLVEFVCLLVSFRPAWLCWVCTPLSWRNNLGFVWTWKMQQSWGRVASITFLFTRLTEIPFAILPIVVYRHRHMLRLVVDHVTRCRFSNTTRCVHISDCLVLNVFQPWRWACEMPQNAISADPPTFRDARRAFVLVVLNLRGCCDVRLISLL